MVRLVFDWIGRTIEVVDQSSSSGTWPVKLYINGRNFASFEISQNGTAIVQAPTDGSFIQLGTYTVEYPTETFNYDLTYTRPKDDVLVTIDGFNSRITIKDNTPYQNVLSYTLSFYSSDGQSYSVNDTVFTLNPIFSGKQKVVIESIIKSTGANYEINDTISFTKEFWAYKLEAEVLFAEVENRLAEYNRLVALNNRQAIEYKKKSHLLNIFQDEYERAARAGDKVKAYRYLAEIYIELYGIEQDVFEIPVIELPQYDGHTHDNKIVLDGLTDVGGDLYYLGERVGLDESGRVKLTISDTLGYIGDKIGDGLEITNNQIDVSALGTLAKIKTVDGVGSGLDAEYLGGIKYDQFSLITHNHDDRYSLLGHTHDYEPAISKSKGYAYWDNGWLFKDESYALEGHTHDIYYTKDELATSGQAVVSWENIVGEPSNYSPVAHGATHISGGGDPIPIFSPTNSGLVPHPGAGDKRFLASTGEWEFLRDNLSDYLESGFDRENVQSIGDISFNESTREFTIQPQSGQSNFYFYSDGKYYEKTTSITVQIPNVSGLYLFYFDVDGILQASSYSETLIIDIVLKYAFVAYVYWNDTAGKAIIFGDERHGIRMDGETHLYLHKTFGSRYYSGMTPDITVGSSTLGALGISDGKFFDEDIEHNVSQQNTISILYLEGAGIWNKTSLGTSLSIPNGATIGYNLYSGGSWTQGVVNANEYMIMHVFCTNNVDDKYVLIQGQNKYSNKNAARSAMESEIRNLYTVGLPSVEYIPIASFILNGNGVVVADDAGNAYTDWRSVKTLVGGGVPINDHQQLVNRSALDSHPIDAITGLQDALDTKLDESEFSASNILSKLLTVDGHGSGLDADTIDGYHASDIVFQGVPTGQVDVGYVPFISRTNWDLYSTTIFCETTEGGVVSRYFIGADRLADGKHGMFWIAAKSDDNIILRLGNSFAKHEDPIVNALDVVLVSEESDATSSAELTGINTDVTMVNYSGYDPSYPAYLYGHKISTLINSRTAGFDGIVAEQKCLDIKYGHDSINASSSPTSTAAYGIFITPYAKKGTITNAYDIYLDAEQTGGTVTNGFSIYQANTKDNYFKGNIITEKQLISSIATGTSPLQVTSTTVVTNLNSDMLDGKHSTEFLNVVNTQYKIINDTYGLTLFPVATGEIPTSGWAREFKFKSGESGTYYGAIGVYGTEDNVNYTYLVANGSGNTSHSSLNTLRIYPTYPAWGTNKIWHAGNDGSGSGLNADLLDGYHSSSFALASHTHSNYTPYESNTQTIPANTGKWIRIATSVNTVYRSEGLFEVEYTVGGYHGRVSFRASSHYNNYDSVRIVKINGSHYKNGSIGVQTARVVFKNGVYSNEYAYVELYVKNYNTTSTMSVYTRMVDAIGWTLTTGNGSIPTGYTSKNLSLMLGYPIYSTDDTRSVVLTSSGVLSINAQYARNNVVSNIVQNTTINIYYIPDGYMGSILLYLNGTYTLSIGSVTNESGVAYSKYLIGNLSNLSAGYYLLTYRAIPDTSGNLKCFISISDKFTSI